MSEKVIDFRSKQPVDAEAEEAPVKQANAVVVTQIEEILAQAKLGKVIGAIIMTVDDEDTWLKQIVGACLLEPARAVGHLEILKSAIFQLCMNIQN